MKERFLLCMLCICFCHIGHTQTIGAMRVNNPTALFPYLSLTGLYGYADAMGNIVIEPEYERADLFHQGVALVRRQGEKEMIIDMHNNPIVVPDRFSEMRLRTIGRRSFIELTYNYNNSWRFWDWKFLPDLSFFGSPSRHRLFDTRVPRERRTLYTLDGQHKIQSKKSAKGKRNAYFYLRYISENTIQVDHQFFKLKDGGVKPIARGVATDNALSGGNYLQKKGTAFRIIDSLGQQIGKRKFRPIPEIRLEVEGEILVLGAEFHYPTYSKTSNFYQDGQGTVYIYPDLNKEFPKQISLYPFDDSIRAAELLTQTQSISPIPNSNRFLLVTKFGSRVFVLDTTGHWRDPMESKQQITVVSSPGNILWPSYIDMLGAIVLPEGANVRSFRSLPNRRDLFKVTIQYKEQRLTGIWEPASAEWIIPPAYNGLSEHNFQYPFIAFQIEKDGKWGYYDLEKRTVHITPTYDYIEGCCWVNISNGTAKNRFYLDVKQRIEFREKL